MKKQSLILAALAVTTLHGCVSMFDVQSSTSQFGCAGMPEGVKCLSVTDVYKATESSDYVNGEVAKKWKDEQEGKVNSAPARPTDPTGAGLAPMADKPLPIRQPAKVMRVWINSYEDEEGDLISGQYAFTEIEGRKWSIGADAPTDKSVISPLKAGTRNSVRELPSPLAIPTKK